MVKCSGTTVLPSSETACRAMESASISPFFVCGAATTGQRSSVAHGLERDAAPGLRGRRPHCKKRLFSLFFPLPFRQHLRGRSRPAQQTVFIGKQHRAHPVCARRPGGRDAAPRPRSRLSSTGARSPASSSSAMHASVVAASSSAAQVFCDAPHTAAWAHSSSVRQSAYRLCVFMTPPASFDQLADVPHQQHVGKAERQRPRPVRRR